MVHFSSRCDYQQVTMPELSAIQGFPHPELPIATEHKKYFPFPEALKVLSPAEQRVLIASCMHWAQIGSWSFFSIMTKDKSLIRQLSADAAGARLASALAGGDSQVEVVEDSQDPGI